MDGVLLAFAGWLEATGFGPWSRNAPWVYPLANTLHLLGLVMLVGSIGVVDLRVVGFWRALPLPSLSAALTPIAVAGIAILALSGVMLFAADGKALAASAVFHTKLVLVAAALINAAVFRFYLTRSRDALAAPSVTARLSAGGSLLLWLAVAAAGRLIAYY